MGAAWPLEGARTRQNHCGGLLGYSAIILAADTVISFVREPGADEIILSKPADEDHARRILRMLRGRAHHIYTGVTLLRTGDHPLQLTRAVLTIVHMRDYSDEEIEAYVATGGPLDKAGGYTIQDKDFHPVDHIDGSYSNVVGLPLEAVQEMLKDVG